MKNTLILIMIIMLTVFGAEFLLKILTKPSNLSSGRIFGIELPPIWVIPKTKIDAIDRDRFYATKKRGTGITWGDWMGIQREDEQLGYCPKEGSKSENGWWRANDMGARSSTELNKEIPCGVTRILLFGDSFTQGSRLKEENTWAFQLDKHHQTLEPINFGVDGYSMSQCFLRYKKLCFKLNFDVVHVMFVPSVDLFRDINTMRYLHGWDSYKPNPRFTIKDNELHLIPPPYMTLKAMLQENQPGGGVVSEKLLNHLRANDAYYIRERYEKTGLSRWSTIFRLWLSYTSQQKYKALDVSLYDPEGEAILVTKAIFRTWAEEVRGAGGKFIVSILPVMSDVKKFKVDPVFRNKWQQMIAAICPLTGICWDLMEDLLPALEVLDTADGGHYGPKSNAIIADILAAKEWD